MSKEYIDKLALIEIRDKKVLVALSQGKDKWYVPGGKREAGETDQQALVREIGEELGVELDPNTITYFNTYEAQAHGKPIGTMVRLTCYTGTLLSIPTPHAEIAKIEYFSYDQRSLGSDSTQLMMDDLKEKNLID
jgi:8-oxo-dGTP diphosphatase